MDLDHTRDVEFLTEMRERLGKARNGDVTQLEYLAQMIEDWIDELTPNVEGNRARANRSPRSEPAFRALRLTAKLERY